MVKKIFKILKSKKLKYILVIFYLNIILKVILLIFLFQKNFEKTQYIIKFNRKKNKLFSFGVGT
jgi:hypothetical protein